MTVKSAPPRCAICASLPPRPHAFVQTWLQNPVGVEASSLSEAEVQTSCVYNGLELLLSRMLRPVWLREVVDEDAVWKRTHPAQWLSVELLSSVMVPSSN